MTRAPLFYRLRGFERLIVNERESVLTIYQGKIADILRPGVHYVKSSDLIREVHALDGFRIITPYKGAIFAERPDLVAEHLTEVRTGPDEVAIVYRDGRPVDMLLPDARSVYLTDAGPFEIERHALASDLMVDPALAQRLKAANMVGGPMMLTDEVEDGHVGVLTINGVREKILPPGRHSFYLMGRHISIRMVDMRTRTHDVTGQEILTKDRVTIRVNLTATYRVTDPELATSAVADFAEALHRALQLAFRKTLGALTLDRLLAEKVSVDTQAAETVRADMARIGIAVGEIALKDVILPGEMRDILTAVVAAVKEAEANVIRRREETNATRSLLNTAKVMADNPVMLRLKELEALENIAGKVERLTVTNGTEGLLSDVVRLRD